MLLKAIPDMGYDPAASASAEEAVRLLDKNPFPIAILDLNLPGMSGLELLEIIRKRYPQTQVIILTGYGSLDAAQKAIRLDAVDFLTKPVTLEEIETAIDRAWRRFSISTNQTALKPSLANSHQTAKPVDQAIDDYERDHILQTLARNNGNRADAAKELGISLRKLYYRLSEYERLGLLDNFKP